MEHLCIFIDNNSNKASFIDTILYKSEIENFEAFNSQNGKLFSPLSLKRFIDEEERHDTKILSDSNQPLKTMSSGEQKKALLFHILATNPDYVILDNPFDNLDTDFQFQLKELLVGHSERIIFIQLTSRKTDILPFIKNYGRLNKNTFTIVEQNNLNSSIDTSSYFNGKIPPALKAIEILSDTLVKFRDVSVSYGDTQILNTISWEIKTGEFWQLIGKNGSGKSTLLSMITGDNPKAFGQEIYLFGNKKGTGESVWDIKRKLGYFSPAMTDKFSGRHSIEHMLLSGLTDSIGLYTRPTETQKRYIKQWLILLNLWEERNILFCDLSLGKQRLVMTARAMVKHPPLLILDEPTASMDDASAQLLVALVNKISNETNTTIVFVSHRTEPGLTPKKVFQLQFTENGSIGYIDSPK